MDCQKFAEGQF